MEYAHASRWRSGLKATAILPVAVAGVNLLARDAFAVRADDSLPKKALRALPSAFVAPDMAGNTVGDTIVAAGMAAASFEVAKRTTSKKELAMIGLGAQVLACAVNTAIEQAGWLSDEERTQEDVGFSSISMAWATKYLFDRAAESKTKKERLRWGIGAAALIGAATVGAYVTKDSFGGKLDAAAHTSGAAVGIAAFAANRLLKK